MGFSPPSSPFSHGENYEKKRCIRRSCTPTATYEAHAVINKPHYLKTLFIIFPTLRKKSVLRGDCARNPRSDGSGSYKTSMGGQRAMKLNLTESKGKFLYGGCGRAAARRREGSIN
ncbi:hypothetical protein EVAR_75493_1 [Eumeta japonica]|uniref:Uncharacterized protein n=1 Tax=Eumeta variegata TaxID=151549 RepID=A0A4C1TK24_EUMVA|nr:hypothetical protein EVAR_75493_1 [Eumeta japonica]